MLYCPLLPCAGPVATARGVPAVVLKLAELQKTSRTFCPRDVYGGKVSYEIGHDAQVSFIASARRFTTCSSFLRSATREADFGCSKNEQPSRILNC